MHHCNSDNTKDNEEFLGFTNKSCTKLSVLFIRLQVNYLPVQVHNDDETPITVYNDDEESVAEVLNHGRAEYLLEDDSKNEEI